MRSVGFCRAVVVWNMADVLKCVCFLVGLCLFLLLDLGFATSSAQGKHTFTLSELLFLVLEQVLLKLAQIGHHRFCVLLRTTQVISAFSFSNEYAYL